MMAQAVPASSPVGLSRGRVLAAAIELIDSVGLRALTMRRLGEVLGVEGMAIYHYVAGREDLLDGVVEVVTADLAAIDIPEGSSDWRTYLRRLSDGFDDLAATHPRVFPLFMTHPGGGPWWLRPPLRHPAWHHRFTTTLGLCGFDAAESETAYRWFTSFLTGQLLPQVTSVVVSPLDDDPQAARRRSEESRRDFDAAFASLMGRLSPSSRAIPQQRSADLSPTPPYG